MGQEGGTVGIHSSWQPAGFVAGEEQLKAVQKQLEQQWQLHWQQLVPDSSQSEPGWQL